MATQVSLNDGAVASAGALAIQTNGTTQAVSISTGQVATLAQNPILTSGTANGVAYLNGSKVLTTGSALTFNGNQLEIVAGSGNYPSKFTGASGTAGYLYSDGNGFGITDNGVSNGVYIRPAISSTIFYAGNAEGFRLTSTSLYTASTINVGIGTTSPATKLHISTDGTYDPLRLQSTQSGFERSWTIGPNVGANGFFVIRDSTAGANRLAIDSSGNLLVGTTSNASSRRLLVESSTTSGYPFEFKNTASSGTPYGFVISYSGTAPNNTGSSFLYLGDNAALRFEVRSNGGVANYSANNVNLSDERTKTEIQNAGSYLAKICSIPVRTFKYKDQTDDLLNLGVIAQEVEAVAPELVDTTGFGETPDDGVPLKAIYQTDLQYALMKCIQEQQALITQLTARITALEGA